VQRLGEVWRALVDDLEEIADALAVTDDELRNISPSADVRRRIGNSLELILRSSADDGSSLGELRRRAAETDRAVRAVHARVHRDSVNLGVVGVTRSGKSTLLRSITGLGTREVPSSQYNPTTAAPSRIYHKPGPFRAVVNLHDWTSFRDSYLERLHRSARLGPTPRTLAEFEARSYDAHRVDLAVQPYVEKLHIARRTLNSYRQLLDAAGPLTLAEGELRPYVAYPGEGDEESDRPYHAVRSVEIYCTFHNVSAARLGLVDMPGEGEAGLNVEELFIERMRTEVDLLLLLKRPAEKDSFITGADESALRSVDAARGGVELRDAFRVVVNPDLVRHLPGHLANALEKIDAKVRDRGIGVFVADVDSPSDVARNVLGPALEHLADRLAEMDRAAVSAVLRDVEQLSSDVATFVDMLASTVKGWRAGQSSQETQLAKLSRKLRDKVSRDLWDLMVTYDRSVADGAVDKDLGAAITSAAQTARAQLADGFGKGRDQWIEEIHNAAPGRNFSSRELAFVEARGSVAEIFDNIDASLVEAVRRLWTEVAQKLHEGLTDELIPASDDGQAALKALRETALAREAEHLPAAIDDLLHLKIDYGSLVLRVTRPILRGISLKPPPRPASVSAGGELGLAVLDGATALGVGVPISPIVTAAANWWDAQQSTVAVPKVATNATYGPSDDAAEFFAELSDVVTDCIEELEEALLTEARLMPRALAAAIDRFWNATCVADFTEMDFQRLCGPIRAHIWQHEFDGSAARIAEELSKVTDRIRALRRNVESVRSLGSALRLRPPNPGT
jgi:hypothetical protein